MNAVMEYLKGELAHGPVHMTLIDPDKAPFETARELALLASKAGSRAIMVGGSTGLTREGLDDCISGIKEGADLPVILFPPSAGALSPLADAIYFMSMLNSTDPRYIVGEQARGAPFVLKMGLDPIPLAYLIVEPGMAVGRVGKADPILRDDTDRAVGYALCAQFMGMKAVYLEAGSGAPSPVPVEMVQAVREATCINIIAGGGITEPAQAGALVKAGADIIVTGTLVEDHEDPGAVLSEMIAEMKKGWEERF